MIERAFLCISCWLLLIVFSALPPSANAAPSVVDGRREVLQGTHANRGFLPRSCRACHRKMNIAITGEESGCLTCHGGDDARQAMRDAGLLKGKPKLADIENSLQKTYNHPVLTISGVHQRREILPEDQVDVARHSECVDCHSPHLSEKERPFAGLRGKRVGNLIADIEQEYELCYLCHSDSANLPFNSTNKHSEFRIENRSYHPVEAEGRNLYVISLKDPYVEKAEKPNEVSRISCKDCHGNDDPDGAKGPHGSIYRGLLVENFQMDDALPESEFAYALCYKCHERASILGNESFPYHAQHIQGNSAAGVDGTSCITCHDAHGSSNYQYLIRFNEDVVLPNADGKLAFESQGASSRTGSCLLNCHGVEHNPKSY